MSNFGATQMDVALSTQDVRDIFDDAPMADDAPMVDDAPMADDDAAAADGDSVAGGAGEADGGAGAADGDATANAAEEADGDAAADGVGETMEAPPRPQPLSRKRLDPPTSDEAAAAELAQEEDDDDDTPLSQKKAKPAAALFGDEEEEEEDEEDQDDGDDDAVDHDRAVAGLGNLEAEMPADAMVIEDDDIVRIPLEASRGRPDAGDKLVLVGLPTSVRLDSEIFEKDKCAEFEKKIVAFSKTTELQELKNVLLGSETTDIIRCKSSEPVPDDLRQVNLGSLQSTCKYVEFSDGSSAILIGQNAYTQIGGAEFSAVLLEVSQLPVMRVHGDLSQRRIYSFAPSTTNLRKSFLR